jgi:hypothetical protein
MEWGKGHEAVEKNEQVKEVFWTVFIANSRMGDGPGRGPGDSSAGSRGDYGIVKVKHLTIFGMTTNNSFAHP